MSASASSSLAPLVGRMCESGSGSLEKRFSDALSSSRSRRVCGVLCCSAASPSPVPVPPSRGGGGRAAGVVAVAVVVVAAVVVVVVVVVAVVVVVVVASPRNSAMRSRIPTTRRVTGAALGGVGTGGGGGGASAHVWRCDDQCERWHAREQYFARLHFEHRNAETAPQASHESVRIVVEGACAFSDRASRGASDGRASPHRARVARRHRGGEGLDDDLAIVRGDLSSSTGRARQPRGDYVVVVTSVSGE
ncbi:uncharacterized protein MICPUCDRAFT_68681 [Micromonas pusilla CCMP1545]|uniref:Predicted protein n=1 Tax=Micromonas pusilla (strain CCMP1545) TaxID=564608 RepID=C1N3M9_MICPC|nr:uncharacterized protein MICPUCDRAFT_68681 [Micromonas pusilla CCMP1545]EEH53221.1 predicted protein [Micromonas pusilla CCMP1545]|eukprot:XP_003062402.1 predicted protein [Micromonas pusilla CCMP1545]